MKAEPAKQWHSFTPRPGKPKACAKCDHAFAEHTWQWVVDENGKGKPVPIQEASK
jgi:hypothetical protein